MTIARQPNNTLSPANLTPKYEVKLLIDSSKVLEPDHNLSADVSTALKVTKDALNMKVQFLDTDTIDIYNSGWSPRIRLGEDNTKLELTYKKRYSVETDQIDKALTVANADGFHSSTEFKAQIDWGYTRQTLSIHQDQWYLGSGEPFVKLPDQKESRAALIELAPKAFRDSNSENWGVEMPEKSRIFGPIDVQRYTGDFEDEELDIEIWPIKGATAESPLEYIVEVSFKVKKLEKATKLRKKLIAFLDSKEWLLHKDALRTVLIMQRY